MRKRSSSVPRARRSFGAHALSRAGKMVSRLCDTRHGIKTGGHAFIGTERRFEWQKPKKNCDVRLFDRHTGRLSIVCPFARFPFPISSVFL